MNTWLRSRLRLWGFIGLAGLVTLGPAVRGASAESRAPLRIVASIFPLKEFARQIVGTRGNVELFLPPGAEIHNWQPSPRQIIRLNQAHLFLFVGAHLEPWAEGFVRGRSGPGPKLLEAGQGIELLHNDPHLWLDFELDVRIAERIRDALIELDPEGEGLYRRNSETLIGSLRALDRRYREVLAVCRCRTLVVGGHAAFGYLAARYGFTQVSLYGLSPDSEPTPRHLIEVIRKVKELKIPAVFFEAAVNPKLARLLAEETGAQALPLNDGVGLTVEQAAAKLTFADIMDENLKSLSHGLRCL